MTLLLDEHSMRRNQIRDQLRCLATSLMTEIPMNDAAPHIKVVVTTDLPTYVKSNYDCRQLLDTVESLMREHNSHLLRDKLTCLLGDVECFEEATPYHPYLSIQRDGLVRWAIEFPLSMSKKVRGQRFISEKLVELWVRSSILITRDIFELVGFNKSKPMFLLGETRSLTGSLIKRPDPFNKSVCQIGTQRTEFEFEEWIVDESDLSFPHRDIPQAVDVKWEDILCADE